MSITTERAAIAAAANAVAGLNVRPSGTVKTPVVGDGWVIVRRVTPAGFRSVNGTFTIVVALGTEQVKADELFDQWGVLLLDAVTSTIASADVVLEPVAMPVESGVLYGLTLTVTTEV